MLYEGKRRASPLNMRLKRDFEEVPDTQCMKQRSEQKAIATTLNASRIERSMAMAFDLPRPASRLLLLT